MNQQLGYILVPHLFFIDPDTVSSRDWMQLWKRDVFWMDKD